MLSDILRLELQFTVKVTVTVQVSINDQKYVAWKLGNSADNLCHPRSVAEYA